MGYGEADFDIKFGWVFFQAFLKVGRQGGGGAAATSKPTECFGKEIFDSNMLLLFCKIK